MLILKELTEDVRRSIVDVLQENKDVFAWTYEEMSGLDPLLVTYKLAVEPTQMLVKQLPQIFWVEIELQVKVEVEKILKAGFIRPCKHPHWLSNIVLVEKKDRTI